MVTNNTCDYVAELVDAYIDSETNIAESEFVSNHLSSCAACAALVTEHRSLAQQLKALPRLAPSRDILESIDFDNLGGSFGDRHSHVIAPVEEGNSLVDNLVPFPGKIPGADAARDKALSALPSNRRRYRLLAGMTGASIAAVALVFAVNLNRPVVGPDVLTANSNSPADRLSAMEGDKNKAKQHELSAPAPPAETNSVVSAREASSGHGALVANSLRKKPLIKRDSGAGRRISPHIEAAAAEAAIEVALMTEVDEASVVDSLGLATDEDGLYDIKI